MALLKHIITSIGLQINEAKDEFGQSVCWLGVLLSSTANGGRSTSAALTDKRRLYVAECCLKMQMWNGPIRVHKLMAFAGLLIFCSQVLPGSKMYVRSAYILIGSHDKHDIVHLSQQFKMDCAWWRKLMLQRGYCGMLLDRYVISTSFLAWDASDWGMGGFYAQNYAHQHFCIPWAAYERGDRICDLAPVRGTPTWHINYKELYAGFTTVRYWGSSMRGYTVVCYTDSSSVHSWLSNMWGTEW